MLNYREGLDGFLLIFLSQISCVWPMVGLDFSPKKVIYRVRENIMKFILYTQKDPPLTNSICSFFRCKNSSPSLTGISSIKG